MIALSLLADQPVTNNTLVTATGLSISIAANQKVAYTVYLAFTLAGTSSGCQFSMFAPASPTNHACVIRVYNSSTLAMVGMALTTSINIALATAATHFAEISGVLETGATAGTLAVQFAQSVTNASAITLKRGSAFWIFHQ